VILKSGLVAAGSRCHIFIIDLWERLPAAIETNSSDVAYFMNHTEAVGKGQKSERQSKPN
jgi:hypothetical protein